MGLRLLAFVLAAAVVTGGCGAQHATLPGACTLGPASMRRALAAAPAPVHLRDGSRLSDCVAGARDEGDLQSFGYIVTQVADGLAARAGADPRAAVQLGYLIGAARRGAARTNGITLELAHRLESAGRRAGRLTPAGSRALVRGIAAGARTG